MDLKNSPADIREWATNYLNQIFDIPRAFGSREAVEMQVLMLLELIGFIDEPNDSSSWILLSYNFYLKKLNIYPPLSKKQFSEQEFIKILSQFASGLA
jgi:hypothetical protein